MILIFINLLQMECIDYQAHYVETALDFVKGTATSRERWGLVIYAAISEIPLDAEYCADLGCGNAYYHNKVLNQRPKLKKLVGIDFSSTMIELIPPEIKNNPKTQYFLNDLTQSIINKQIFDCMFSIFTLQYITQEKLESYLSNCYEMLKPNGKVLFISFQQNNFKNDPIVHNNIIDYRLIWKHQKDIENGQIGTIHVNKGGWQADMIFWKNETMIKHLQNAGFKAQIKYIEENQIDKNLFTEQEIKALVNSKAFRIVIGTKPK